MKSKRTIVLTGVTRGLGSAMVQEFVRLGHIVVGCGRGQAAIQKLQESCAAPHDFSAIDVACDDQVRGWAERLLSVCGAPDLLINNAAVINRNAVLWEISSQEFSSVIDVNIKGVANVIRHFLPAMVARRKGVIVNFSSGWGRCTAAEVAPYCASKWAVEGLTQALAQELPPGMAAVPLNPGIINTEMLQSCFGESAAAYPAPDEWAKAAVPFMLSLDRQHNGVSLSVPSS